MDTQPTDTIERVFEVIVLKPRIISVGNGRLTLRWKKFQHSHLPFIKGQYLKDPALARQKVEEEVLEKLKELDPIEPSICDEIKQLDLVEPRWDQRPRPYHDIIIIERMPRPQVIS